jgi:hypothetical protein
VYTATHTTRHDCALCTRRCVCRNLLLLDTTVQCVHVSVYMNLLLLDTTVQCVHVSVYMNLLLLDTTVQCTQPATSVCYSGTVGGLQRHCPSGFPCHCPSGLVAYLESGSPTAAVRLERASSPPVIMHPSGEPTQPSMVAPSGTSASSGEPTRCHLGMLFVRVIVASAALGLTFVC